MRPALLGKLSVLKAGADGLDMNHDAGPQPALSGIPGQVISTGPTAAGQQTCCIKNPVPGQLPQLEPVHGAALRLRLDESCPTLPPGRWGATRYGGVSQS